MILKQISEMRKSVIPLRGYLESINEDMGKFWRRLSQYHNIVKWITTSNIDDNMGRLYSKWENNSAMENWKSMNKGYVEDYGATRRVRKGEFIAETGKPFLFFYSTILQPASSENKQWSPLSVGKPLEDESQWHGLRYQE